MAWFITPQYRFAFAADGSPTDGDGEMVVTYRGSISGDQALSDAKRRFKEWQTTPSCLTRIRNAHQVVVV